MEFTFFLAWNAAGGGCEINVGKQINLIQNSNDKAILVGIFNNNDVLARNFSPAS